VRDIKDDAEQIGQVLVRIKRLHPDAKIPQYQTSGSSGMDLHCLEPVHLQARRVFVARTGIAVEIPPGYEGQIRPRSGLAAKSCVTVLNSPGTIDSDYRGEICVILFCHAWDGRKFDAGDRIAQLVISPVMLANVVEVAELDDTERGGGGFGSTGV
jgi:dUTP pyrophosphatase